MTTSEIEKICKQKEQELMHKYFGNLVKEAAVERPETIGHYDKDLPYKVEEEYLNFLRELWKEVNTDPSRSFEEILDKRDLGVILTEDDRAAIERAHENAVRRTVWERITSSNHRDVTFYKGLLEECTRELLSCLRCDFIEDVRPSA